MLPLKLKVEDLMCGHDGKYMCSVKGKFDYRKSIEPIQLFKLECGCWIVLDGNNRIGSMLKAMPKSCIGDYPKGIFIEILPESFDVNDIYYWVSHPKPFKYIIPFSNELNSLKQHKNKYADIKEYEKKIKSLNSILTAQKHICINELTNKSIQWTAE